MTPFISTKLKKFNNNHKNNEAIKYDDFTRPTLSANFGYKNFE